MKVSELIEALSSLNPNSEVYIDDYYQGTSSIDPSKIRVHEYGVYIEIY